MCMPGIATDIHAQRTGSGTNPPFSARHVGCQCSIGNAVKHFSAASGCCGGSGTSPEFRRAYGNSEFWRNPLPKILHSVASIGVSSVLSVPLCFSWTAHLRPHRDEPRWGRTLFSQFFREKEKHRGTETTEPSSRGLPSNTQRKSETRDQARSAETASDNQVESPQCTENLLDGM
jgi:hypothetical protein